MYYQSELSPETVSVYSKVFGVLLVDEGGYNTLRQKTANVLYLKARSFNHEIQLLVKLGVKVGIHLFYIFLTANTTRRNFNRVDVTSFTILSS
jgi:hypothetical protein